MRPLRIKASGTPITGANYQGLQEMSDGEINQYLSNVITQKFADDSDGTGTAELNINGSGTGIGTFVDTQRNDAIGTHPSGGATTTTNYAFNQVTTAVAETVTDRVVGWDNAIKQMTDGDLDTDVLDKAIDSMVTESAYTVGQYSLRPTAPTGGTWTSRYTITDTAQGGNSTTYLWQKTAPTSSPNSDLAALKTDGSSVRMMSDAEMEQMVPSFRNRIIDTNIGTYKVQQAAPTSGGTWVQMGDSFSNTQQEIASENYVGNYTGSYTGAYNQAFSGTYAGAYVGAKTYTGNYTGTYAGNYVGGYVGAKTYSGSYTGNYAGAYQGNYVGTAAYSGNYSGSYQGNYVLYYAGYAHATYTGYYSGTYTGYYTGPKTYTGYYTGTYTGYYTGNYVGTSAYSGTYTGYYSGTYTGNYVGTSAYTGYYTGSYTGYFSGSYSGTYAGTYAGDTIQASKETLSTIALWLRTA